MSGPGVAPARRRDLRLAVTALALLLTRERRRGVPDEGGADGTGQPGGAHRPRSGEDGHAARDRALAVPCPWCSSPAGSPCVVWGSAAPLRRAPAHPARLVAGAADAVG